MQSNYRDRKVRKELLHAYVWTNHAQFKMRQYRLSEALIKRVIRFPKRTEEGIVPHTIAVMRPAQSKKYHEIWCMYVVISYLSPNANRRSIKQKQLKIITAWRYPGKSPERNPIPTDILREVKLLLGI